VVLVVGDVRLVLAEGSEIVIRPAFDREAGLDLGAPRRPSTSAQW
jgi:hypothetical protein